MTPEQLDQIITAVRDALAAGRPPYDYMVVLIPVLTGLAGWFASIWWQSRQFRKDNQRQHYLQTRDKAHFLLEEYGRLTDLTYEYFKSSKNQANRGIVPDEDAAGDFITQFQTMLARIHQSLKLMFPGQRFETVPIAQQSDRLVEVTRKMSSLARFLASLPQSSARDSRVTDEQNERTRQIQTESEEIIRTLATEVGRVENQMIETANALAADLGIGPPKPRRGITRRKK